MEVVTGVKAEERLETYREGGKSDANGGGNNRNDEAEGKTPTQREEYAMD